MNYWTLKAQGSSFALLAGLSLGAASSQTTPVPEVPKSLTEPETGQRFPISRGFPGRSDLRVETLGVGHRKLFGANYYSIALYVEIPSLKKAMGVAAGADEVIQILEAGGVAFCLDLQYTRGVSGRRRGGVIRERMEKVWESSESFGKDPEAMKLMGFFTREARRGDESFLWFHPDGRILLEEAGKTTVQVRSARVRKAILAIYFGPNPVSQDLKRSLFSRLDGVLLSPGSP